MPDPIGKGVQAITARSDLFEGCGMSEEVTNNETAHRYELVIDGQTAIAAYERRGDVVVFTHTEVPQALEGRGVGSRLIKSALADVRQQGRCVRADCSFVADYLARHPDAADAIA
jgi:predicted GNAT family acetyltransferase